MPYQPNAPLLSPTKRAAALAGESHFSTSGTASATSAAPKDAGLNLRRVAATPGGRAFLAAAVVVGCVIDYELWTLYGAKYFSGKGQQ
ncbi:hypothetical protein F5Y12DRAFT_725444 [Xylaria sp. FL1777]|nr:hypothetical protein F5Y12DRAFT_725444 [Xylaria sp. FL1777]